MFRKSFFAAALAVAALASAAAVAVAADPAKPPAVVEQAAPTTVHVCIFRLKKDAPADAVEKIIADCHTMLETIPSVRLVKVGRPSPADQSTPKVSVHDYDIALAVFFDNPAGLKTYLEHETHLKFVKMYEPYFDMEKLQVFDFSDQKK